MKPATTTIALLVANIVLLGYIFFVERHAATTPEAEIADEYLSYFEPDAVAELSLQTDEGSAQIVRQADGSWRFVTPFEDRVAPELMAEILAYASRLKIEGEVSAKEIESEGYQPSYFGFDQRTAKVEFTDAGGASLAAFELGGPTPVKESVFARRAGGAGDEGTVYQVWSDLREMLMLSFDELRDRRLIFAKTEELWRAKFQPPSLGSDGMIHVERGPDERWQLKAPLKARCDQESVNYIIGLLVKAEVEEFVDDSAADLSAFDSKYRIVLKKRTPVESDAKLEIEFGKVPENEGESVLARMPGGRPGLFLVDRRLVESLEMDAFTLRDRTLAEIDYDAVAAVTIKRGGIKGAPDQPDQPAQPDIVLRRLVQGWLLFRESTGNKPESANGRMVRDLIERINSERVRAFTNDAAVDLAPYGLDNPKIEVTITRNYVDPDAAPAPGEQAQPIVVEDVLMLGAGFADQEGGNFYAAFKGIPRVYKMDESLPLALFQARALSYKTLQFWPRFFPLNLRKISLLEKGSSLPLELEFDPERTAWTAMRGAEDLTPRVNKVLMDGYLQFLGAPPVGERWTKRSPLSERAMEVPDLSATIDLVDPRDGKTPRRLTLTAAATAANQQFFYVQINDEDELLLIDGDTYQNLVAPLKRFSPGY